MKGTLSNLICRERTEKMDATEIIRDIYDAEKAQEKANNDLERANSNTEMAHDQLNDVKYAKHFQYPHLSVVGVFKQDLFGMFQIENKLDNTWRRLIDRRPEYLQKDIESLKNKTEQNRKMARDAREAADSALQNAVDTPQVRLLESYV